MKNIKVGTPATPINDEVRLDKLLSYEIIDTPPDITFDRIARLAAQLFGSKYAQITFVGREHTFLKSNLTPIPTNLISRKDSLCAVAIQYPGVTVFGDIEAMPNLSSNPYLKEFGFRFYAGAPLLTPEGLQLGTVCVYDTVPREVTDAQLDMLETLSAIVMDELEMRLSTRQAIRVQTDMMNRVVHDLKNPNTTISLSAELIKKKADDAKIVTNFAERIKRSADSVLASLNDLLESSQLSHGSFRLNLEEIDLQQLLAQAIQEVERIADQKRQKITLSCNYFHPILVDRQRLKEAFSNLLRNSIYYAAPDTLISVSIIAGPNEVIMEFKDQGQGLTEEDKAIAFKKFAKLSAKPTAREHGNGMGLSIVKMLIAQHRGKVWAESPGKDQGASFFISLPID